MFEPLFQAGLSFLSHFFCKIFVFDISKLNFRCLFLRWSVEWVAEGPFLQPMIRLFLISRMNLKMRRSMLPIASMRLLACKNGRFWQVIGFFWRSFFACDLYLWTNHVCLAKKNVPGCLSLITLRLQTFYTPL